MRLDAAVSCNFESTFKCGYQSTELGALHWSRTNAGSVINTETGPSSDIKGTKSGKLVIINVCDKHQTFGQILDNAALKLCACIIFLHTVFNNFGKRKPISTLLFHY